MMFEFNWKMPFIIIGLLLIGAAISVLTASFLYADIGQYKFDPLLWISGLIYKTNLFAVALSGTIGLLTGLLPLIAYFRFIFPRRKLYGEARFAKAHEIRKAGLFKAGGDKLLLGKYKNKYLYYQGDLHPFLAAPTGSGKGVGYVIPNMLNWQHSVVLLDIKKEGWQATSGYRTRVLKQPCYYFDPLNDQKQTIRINPFSYVRVGTDHRVSDIRGIAESLIPSHEGRDNDWNLFARKLFVSTSLLVFETGALFGWKKSIGQVYRIINSETDLAEFFKATIKTASEHIILSEECRGALLAFSRQPPKQREGTIGTLDGALQLWQSALVDLATSHSDIDFRTFRQTPQSLYIVSTNDDLKKLNDLFKLIIETLLSANTKQTPKENPANNIPLLLLMDEFLAIGKMPKLVHAMSYVRGYNIRLSPVLQSTSQLMSQYGHADTDAFLENTDVRIIYRPKQESAKKLSEMLGTTTVKQRSFSKSQGNPRNVQTSEQSRALFLPQELQELPDDRSIVFIENLKPIFGHKIRYYKERLFKKRLLPECPLPKPIHTGHAVPINLKTIEKTSNAVLPDQEIDALADNLIQTTLENLKHD